jgi:hypothetical protein
MQCTRIKDSSSVHPARLHHSRNGSENGDHGPGIGHPGRNQAGKA